MDYTQWNHAISSYFFNNQQAQRPVYLGLDEEVLREIANAHDIAPDDGLTDLCAAIKRWIRPKDNRSQPFFKFLHLRLWESRVAKEPHTPPPFVGILALSVLAAARMAHDDDLSVTSANYYVRLNKLLGNGAVRGQPKGFDAISQQWERLNAWLTTSLEGEFGLPTANNRNGYGAYVGYPMSQVLLRQADRAKLPEFFAWCGFVEGEGIAIDVMRDRLARYVQLTYCPFSTQLQRIFEKQRTAQIDQLAELVIDELASWDGVEVRHDGSRSAEIKLQIEGRRFFELTLWPFAPKDFPEGRYDSADLQRDEDDPDWFEPLEEKFVRCFLQGKTVELQQGKYSLHCRARFVIPFQQDESGTLGGWVGCRRVRIGEPTWILCHTRFQAEVERLLTACSENEVTRPLRGRVGIYQNWLCYRNVRLVRRPNFHVRSELDCLIPDSAVSIRLVGGLRLERGVWLRGGEPQVVISAENPLPVFLNDKPISNPDNRIDLQTLNLPNGQYTLTIEGRHKRFRVVDKVLKSETTYGYQVVKQREQIYHPVGNGLQLPPAEIPNAHIFIAGAQLLRSADAKPVRRREMLVLPYGAIQYIILGRKIGDVYEPKLPTSLPKWQAESKGLWDGYKVLVPFAPQWVIRVSSNKNQYLRAVGLVAPIEEAVSEPEKVAAWCYWAGRNIGRKLKGVERERWQQYRQVARQQR